jgi:hypothetical protein
VKEGGAGIPDVDLLYVIRTAVSSDGWVARSGACDFDYDFRKAPKIGMMEVNLNYFDLEDTIEDNHAVIMHEMTHTFGFASWLYKYWKNKDDNYNLYDQDKYFPNPIDMRGKATALIATPRVLKEAREHFNCPTLMGMELEN